VAGAPAAGASAVSSRSCCEKMDNVAVPMCTGCGMQVSADVQCDSCSDPNKWKCIEMSKEAYDALIDCKELCWFCKGCSEDVVKTKDSKEDKGLGLFERVMDKLCLMEDRLKKKVDVTVFEELERKIQKLRGGHEPESGGVKGKNK